MKKHERGDGAMFAVDAALLVLTFVPIIVLLAIGVAALMDWMGWGP